VEISDVILLRTTFASSSHLPEVSGQQLDFAAPTIVPLTSTIEHVLACSYSYHIATANRSEAIALSAKSIAKTPPEHLF
jgi:hypothetical protein